MLYFLYAANVSAAEEYIRLIRTRNENQSKLAQLRGLASNLELPSPEEVTIRMGQEFILIADAGTELLYGTPMCF